MELEEGGKKKKMKSEIRRLGIERKERRKEKWMKSGMSRMSWWYFRVKFCQDPLNVHGPLFYDNEQTVEFDFNLK